VPAAAESGNSGRRLRREESNAIEALWLYAQALTDRPARLKSPSGTSWITQLITLGCL